MTIINNILGKKVTRSGEAFQPSASTSCSSDDDENSEPPTAKRPAIASSESVEIASFVSSRSLSADSRFNLLINHFKPGTDHKFPKSSGTGRSFKHQWLTQFPWLTYSKQENGGFCLPCLIFASSGYRGSDPGVLVSRPLTAFTKASELLRIGMHTNSIIKMLQMSL